MKTFLALSVVLLASMTLSAAALDYDVKPPTVQERLKEMDLNIAIKQYERVRIEETEIRLRQIHQEATFGTNSNEVKICVHELESVSALSHELKQQISKLTEELQLFVKKK